MTRLGITSNGPYPSDYEVIDLDTGDPIDGVTAFTLEVDVYKPTVTLTLRMEPNLEYVNVNISVPEMPANDPQS